MLVSTGRRAGRSHRDRQIPCQDAYAVHQAMDGSQVASAVADGLGSRPLSHEGSEAAAKAAAASLGASRRWGPAAVHRAFRAARTAIERRARELGASPHDLATTLQVVGLSSTNVIAGIVGDGAVLCGGTEPRILLGPEDSEYANQVVPITDPNWRDHLRIATTTDASQVYLFTDGLTRLLLARQARTWTPYEPFFQAFQPKLKPKTFTEELVPRFLDTDAVDAAWDDDKCLVVMGLD